MNNNTNQWIFFLVVGLILFYFFSTTRSDVVIIEKGTEGMEDITAEMEAIAAEMEEKEVQKMGVPSACGIPPNFRLKSNRYLAGSGKRSMCRCGPNCRCQGMCQCSPNVNCGPGCAWFKPCNTVSGSASDPHPSTKPCMFHINKKSSAWNVPYEPGANNTYDDLVWHYMSPRMVLQNNCMRCNEFGPGTNHTVPEGVAENTTAEHSETVGIPQQGVSSLLYNNLETDPSIAQFPHTLSPPRNNGIVPMEQSCVLAKANDPSKCGCDGFGKCVYNFH